MLFCLIKGKEIFGIILFPAYLYLPNYNNPFILITGYLRFCVKFEKLEAGYTEQ